MVVLYNSESHFPSINFGDHVSSVIIVGGTWTVYQRSNYEGRSSRLGPGEYTFINRLYVGDDSISSARRN
jgi:hypothetical protein